MENIGRQRRAFFPGRFHNRAVVVARRTLQIGHPFHRAGSEMFLVADRARTILDHVRLVQIVFLRGAERRILLVAILAFEID